MPPGCRRRTRVAGGRKVEGARPDAPSDRDPGLFRDPVTSIARCGRTGPFLQRCAGVPGDPARDGDRVCEAWPLTVPPTGQGTASCQFVNRACPLRSYGCAFGRKHRAAGLEAGIRAGRGLPSPRRSGHPAGTLRRGRRGVRPYPDRAGKPFPAGADRRMPGQTLHGHRRCLVHRTRRVPVGY
jgi:hypothetical protein